VGVGRVSLGVSPAPRGFAFFGERNAGAVHLVRGDRLLCSRIAVPESRLPGTVPRARVPCSALPARAELRDGLATAAGVSLERRREPLACCAHSQKPPSSISKARSTARMMWSEISSVGLWQLSG